MATVYYWPLSLSGVGHLALQLHDDKKTYISFWPGRDVNDSKKDKKWNLIMAEGRFQKSLNDDIADEGGQKPLKLAIPVNMINIENVRKQFVLDGPETEPEVHVIIKLSDMPREYLEAFRKDLDDPEHYGTKEEKETLKIKLEELISGLSKAEKKTTNFQLDCARGKNYSFVVSNCAQFIYRLLKDTDDKALLEDFTGEGLLWTPHQVYRRLEKAKNQKLARETSNRIVY